MFSDEIIDEKIARLDEIAINVFSCIDCNLHRNRKKTVPGLFPREAFKELVNIMFIGEAPGELEDATGEPFVGRAGKLLDKLTNEKLGIGRSKYHLCNILRCRPPNNRDPEPIETFVCAVHLYRQIGIVQPDLIIALGATAMHLLLNGKEVDLFSIVSKKRLPVTEARNKIYNIETPSVFNFPSWKGELIVTYHPAGMLRDDRLMKWGALDFEFIAKRIEMIKNRKLLQHAS